jgi:hypothetical protein
MIGKKKKPPAKGEEKPGAEALKGLRRPLREEKRETVFKAVCILRAGRE